MSALSKSTVVDMESTGGRPTARPNLPEENELILTLRRAMQLGEQVLDLHGDDCDCNLCIDLEGLLYNLRVGESLVESELIPVLEDGELERVLRRDVSVHADEPAVVASR